MMVGKKRPPTESGSGRGGHAVTGCKAMGKKTKKQDK